MKLPLWLNSPNRFLLLLAVLFSLQLLVRLVTSPVTELDESEVIVFSQHWRLGYGPQPPLYTWLQIPIFALTGPSVLGLALLKNLILFGTYAFTYASGRRLTGQHSGGVLAALGLLFIPQIAWESQRDLTHSVLATGMAAAAFHSFLRLRDSATWGRYAALGAWCGLGLLSKYNFALVMVGLLGAGLAVREFRPLVLNVRLVASGIVCALVVLPHVWWALDHAGAVSASAHKFNVTTESSWLQTAAVSVWQFFRAWFSHVFIFSVLALALGWQQVRQLTRQHLRTAEVRFVVCWMVVALSVALVVTVAGRVTLVKGRWLQPLYFSLPLLLTALIGGIASRNMLKRWVALALVVSVAVMAIIWGRVWVKSRFMHSDELNEPFPALAAQLRGDVAGATIITDSFMTGGNLRMAWPDVRILTPRTGDEAPTSGKRVFIFNATNRREPPPSFKRFAEAANVPWDSARVRYVEAPFRFSPERKMRLGFLVAL